MNNVVELHKREKRLYTANDICAMCGIARSTVDSWVNQGLLTKIKIGRKCVRFNVDEVERLLGVV
jgi:predicted site-specific integrase-resolvase